MKGHQIIGELRLHKIQLSLAHVRLKGHQIIGELRLVLTHRHKGGAHWRVTRSLVSYDNLCYCNPSNHYYWRVTRSLVSYDFPYFYHTIRSPQLKGHQIIGELRPVCLFPFLKVLVLKGHQIIGELRLASFVWFTWFSNWRVTRSLVSYDVKSLSKPLPASLKGHQIIGELRQGTADYFNTKNIEGSPDHWWVTTIFSSRYMYFKDWRVTRSLVSYDWYC